MLELVIGTRSFSAVREYLEPALPELRVKQVDPAELLEHLPRATT